MDENGLNALMIRKMLIGRGFTMIQNQLLSDGCMGKIVQYKPPSLRPTSAIPWMLLVGNYCCMSITGRMEQIKEGMANGTPRFIKHKP